MTISSGDVYILHSRKQINAALQRGAVFANVEIDGRIRQLAVDNVRASRRVPNNDNGSLFPDQIESSGDDKTLQVLVAEGWHTAKLIYTLPSDD